MNRISIVLVLLAVTLFGCAGSDSSIGPQDTPNVAYVADLTSAETNLKTMNGGTTVAGWNRLVGPTTFNGAPANVEMLGNVDYVNGSGDFFGFLTLTIGDGSSITMRMFGNAVKNQATGDTAFTCDLKILGGTGSYNNAKGTGTFTGYRDSALGGTVHIDVKANAS